MKLKIILFLAVAAFLSFAWVVEDVPYTLEVTAKIYPAKKWQLLKDTDGSLTSTLYNYQYGIVNNVRSYKLSSGDVAHIDLIPQSSSGTYIGLDDTVAVLYSALIDERIDLVRSELNELNAFLMVDKAGLKSSDIGQAAEQLTYAQQQLELEAKNYNRAYMLYQEKAIAEAEYHLAEAAYELAQTQVKIAANTLESAKTGAKPEQIAYTKARIETAKKELAMLQRQKDSHTLLAPIAGKVDFNVTPEEVLTIEDTSVYILHFPIKLTDKSYVTSFSRISITYPVGTEPMAGQLMDISDKVEYLSGEQLVFAKAVLPSKAKEVSTGMFLRCRIECDRITLWENVTRILKQPMS